MPLGSFGVMESYETLARINRRFGFGLRESELAARLNDDVEVEIRRLVSPESNGVSPAPEAFDDSQLARDPQARGEQRRVVIGSWLKHMVKTPRPLIDRVAWYWHGHLVSGLDKVKFPATMANQIRLYQREGMGAFPELLKKVAVDPAMLEYLDGDGSTKEAPNENFAREVLELFTLGVGNYTEADVQAGARALTGYRVRPLLGDALFSERTHDQTPQTFLGVDGVVDVRTVIEAIAAHPQFALFLPRRMARYFMGQDVSDEVVLQASRRFVASDYLVSEILTSLLESLVDQDTPKSYVVLEPIPWLVCSVRAVLPDLEGFNPLQVGARILRSLGQIPMIPPNVAGWPGGETWFSTSTVIGRSQFAARLINLLPESAEALSRAAASDLDELAHFLVLPTGFSKATKEAMKGLSARARLALALTSPEAVIA